VYQFIYSGFGSPVSHQAGGIGSNINGSPKESKVALSSPEANSHYNQSVASVHQQTPPAVTEQPPKMMVSALHPC
jgi:hypothetical protein